MTPGDRWVTVPWMSWSPDGDRLAYFVRAEKSRTLILQNILNRKIEERIDLRTVDDPESPDISPDGRRVAFAALQGGTGDIFVVDLVTEGGHQRHQGRVRRLRARPGRRTASRSDLPRARQPEREAVPARSRHRHGRRS